MIEEYAVAAQIYKLSPVDMCELARNSVLQSGFEKSLKQHWLGADFSDIQKTNLPLIRLLYRQQTLAQELAMVTKYCQPDQSNGTSETTGESVSSLTQGVHNMHVISSFPGAGLLKERRRRRTLTSTNSEIAGEIADLQEQSS